MEEEIFRDQAKINVKDLKSRYLVNMEELDFLLKQVMCKIDLEVDYESMDSMFDEAEKILKEMKPSFKFPGKIVFHHY
jgi:proteasome assembly chaperone (PAC2) family protein